MRCCSNMAARVLHLPCAKRQPTRRTASHSQSLEAIHRADVSTCSQALTWLERWTQRSTVAVSIRLQIHDRLPTSPFDHRSLTSLKSWRQLLRVAYAPDSARCRHSCRSMLQRWAGQGRADRAMVCGQILAQAVAGKLQQSLHSVWGRAAKKLPGTSRQAAIVALCSPTAQATAFLVLAHLGPCCASRPASSSPCRHEASSIGALPLSTCVRRPAWGIRVREPYLPALRTAPSKTASRRTNTSKQPKTHLLNNLPAGGSAQPPAPPALLGPAAAPALLGRRPAPRSGRQPAPAPAPAARRCLGGRVAGLPPLCMPQRVLQPHFQPPLLPSKLALVLLAGQRWCGWHRRHCCCNQARCQCG